MWDLALILGIGFLGSFGHCVGMCGPITVALSLSKQAEQVKDSSIAAPTCADHDCQSATATNGEALQSQPPTPRQGKPVKPFSWPQFRFHLLLNTGRVLSYTLVGATIGGIGSVLVAGGQVAGVGSSLRQGITVFTGLLLIWFGLCQINPVALPRIPLLNPMQSKGLHERLQEAMAGLALHKSIWTPLLLGLLWGFVPCGFLYAAQIKAAETASIWWGGATLLAFGAGTLPSMVGLGIMSTWLGRDRRQQMFRLGGWITLLVGVLTLLRTGSQMIDYTGHGALLCLLLSLLARPIKRLWSGPLQYRRALGVGAFFLAVAHVLHMVEHAWSWNLRALMFMLPQHQWGIVFGIGGVLLMLPLVLTSFDGAQKRMGHQWRRLHLLSVPALALVAAHCLLVGSSYWGEMRMTWSNHVMIAVLIGAVGVTFLVRSPQVWRLLSLEKWYAPPKS